MESIAVKSAVETLEPTRAKLTVEVSYEELKPSIDHAYSHIAEQVNVPGFRKGKVPARIIDQRVGRAAVIEHAVNDALPGLYRDAVAETGIKPLGQPEVDVTEVPNLTGAVGGQLTFTAEVDVRPEITLPDLSTYEITVDSVEVNDEDVEQRLESLRERFGTLVGVDRAAADGDFVSIDLKATVGEEEVDSVTGTSYQVGAGTMLEGMDEAITGLSAGESTTFTTTLVGGERAGEEAEVTVTVNSVKERELPAADDEFAELASEFDTIDELRADLREQVGKDKNSNRAVAARDQLLERLRGEIEFPLPKNAVDAEIKAHLEAEGKAEDDPHGEEVREDTEKAMRDQFILDELAQALEVQVGQNELLEFLLSTSRQYGMDPNEFIQSAGQAGQIPIFAGELARNKALAVALRRVKVVDGEGKDVDLSDFIGSDDDDAAAALAEAAAVADAAEPAAESAESGESADSADSGDSADSADSGDSADSADSAESAPSAD
ncbi:trigger factor [Oceanitalea stevensii]|uniref:Trigger factor n=1 Tax=Oceanitalea stevensii TaxID=2763072 RepID=A0ABR8YYB7_9MICO|nr:trigger factor [Oceanitalea stevensii]MBD8060706.1 trigger factor [Oceanitalea stevensii]